MGKLLILPVNYDAIKRLCAIMREDDVRECTAALGTFNPDIIAARCTGPGGFGGIGYTKDFEPFFACGLMPTQMPRVMEAYAFGSDKFQGQMIRATKEVKKGLDRAQAERHISLIVAHSQARHVKAHRWLELLGFEKTAVVPEMGYDGSDFYRFERRYDHAA